MTLNLRMPEANDLKPRITVFGVGGAGGNAVNNMIDKELDGVEFVVANTDAQALQQSRAGAKIQIGVKVTEGLGAGARPAVGSAAAEETIEEIVDHLAGAHMCFITAGMGGGTGTGAAPIIAQAARELGILTVGVVTKPFQFEGAKRMRQAEQGVESLQRVVDTLIIIPNQNLFRLANEKTTFTEAFSMADDVLYQGVKGVTDLMVRPGLINLDFADVRAVMDEMGKAMMGTGEASGEDRAVQAAEKAIANPLLDEISLRGAKGVLINITGSDDLTLFELDEAANRIREEVDPDANIIVGSTMEASLDGVMRVSVVATGIDANVDHGQPEMPAHRPMAAVAAAATTDVTEETPVEETTVAAQSEPSLFGRSRVQEETTAADDTVVPEPVYQPEQAAEVEPLAVEAQDSLVAREPGTPTPEAMERLRAAVSKRPDADPEPLKVAAESSPEPAPAPKFGINSLIGRMTGQQNEPAPQPAPAAAPSFGRVDPRVSAQDNDLEADPELEKIEIPAFLRRQAN